MRLSNLQVLSKLLYITVAALLVLATPALAAKQTRAGGANPVDRVDSDGDRIYDDLEAVAAPLSDDERVSVIVVMRERALPERVEQLRRASGLDVSVRFSLIDAVAGRVTKGRLRALAGHPLV